jgi:hypothetical protein
VRFVTTCRAVLLIALLPVCAAAQPPASARVAHRSPVATYYVYSDATLGPIVSIVENAYDYLSMAFGFVLETPIEVHLFPTRIAFWDYVFPGRANIGRTTGYADRFDWSSLGYSSEVAFYTALSGFIRQTGVESR